MNKNPQRDNALGKVPPIDPGDSAGVPGQSGSTHQNAYRQGAQYQSPRNTQQRNVASQPNPYANRQPANRPITSRHDPTHDRNLRAHRAYEARQAQMRQAYEARQQAQARAQVQPQAGVPLSTQAPYGAPTSAQPQPGARPRASYPDQTQVQQPLSAQVPIPARATSRSQTASQAQVPVERDGRQIAADTTITASVAATGTRSYGKASKSKEKKKKRKGSDVSVEDAATVATASAAVAVKDERQQRSRLWTIVFWAAAAVLVLSLGALGYIGFSYWQGDNYYDSIENQAFADESAELSDIQGTKLADVRINWDALRAINPDVVAWVYVPNTPVSYPVVWKEGDDDYYLHHNFSGDPASNFGAQYGAIMLSGKNNPNFSDQNNFFYGHNMANGSMFATFAHNIATETFNAQRDIYLFTPEGNYLLQSFALVRVHQSQIEVTTPNFADAVEFTTFVQNIIDTTLVDAQPVGPPAVDIDKTFAFSTCDGADNTYRLITFCSVAEFVPIGELDDPTVDVLQDPNALDDATADGADQAADASDEGGEATDGGQETQTSEGAEGSQPTDGTQPAEGGEGADGSQTQPDQSTEG